MKGVSTMNKVSVIVCDDCGTKFLKYKDGIPFVGIFAHSVELED
jgi:hypothetical protein